MRFAVRRREEEIPSIAIDEIENNLLHESNFNCSACVCVYAVANR